MHNTVKTMTKSHDETLTRFKCNAVAKIYHFNNSGLTKYAVSFLTMLVGLQVKTQYSMDITSMIGNLDYGDTGMSKIVYVFKANFWN